MRIAGFVAVVAVIATGVLLAAGNQAAAPSEETRVEVRRSKVIVAQARRVVFERSLTVQGNVQAKNLALVSPRVKGTLDEIMVDEGDTVEAGVTHLFQTDPVKLAKTVEVRRQDVNVAEHSLREKRALLEKNQADYEKAEYDWKRYRGLFERGVSDNDELEEARTDFKRCRAMIKHAEALVGLADSLLEQARSALAIAEKDLRDSLVIAPISGRVTNRYQEPGEMSDTDTPVLRIEDPSLLEVSVFLPARAYGEVTPDDTKVRVTVNGVDLGEHVVTYKSPTINDELRTFEVRCLLRDVPGAVVAGAMAQASLVLERREAIGVPRDAIQRRGDGMVVFMAKDNQAQMIPVKTGLEIDGMIEVVSDRVVEGAAVVTVGAYFLNPDTPIVVQNGDDH